MNKWRFFVVDTGGCMWLMALLDHERHRNCDGGDSQVGFLSIILISLVNLRCVQPFGSSI